MLTLFFEKETAAMAGLTPGTGRGFRRDLHALPKEVWLLVFLRLDSFRSVCALMSTCKYLYRVGVSNVLWRELFERKLLKGERELPLFAVEDAAWLFPRDLQGSGVCLVCSASVVALEFQQDLAGVSGNQLVPPLRLHNECWAHRQCLRRRGAELPQCVCGAEIDPDTLTGREQWTCVVCRREQAVVCRLHSGARHCYVCEKCLGHMIENSASFCVCGEAILAEPQHNPRLLAADRLARLSGATGGVEWRSEFRQVHEAGSGELATAVWSGVKAQLLGSTVGVGVLYLWAVVLLYSMSWLSGLKLLCLSFFWFYVLSSMLSEEVVPRVTAVVRQGRVGQGARRRVWRHGKWLRQGALGGLVACLLVFAAALLWDLWFRCSLWAVFVLVSCGLAAGAEPWYPSVSALLITVNLALLPVLASLFKLLAIDVWSWLDLLLELAESLDLVTIAELAAVV